MCTPPPPPVLKKTGHRQQKNPPKSRMSRLAIAQVTTCVVLMGLSVIIYFSMDRLFDGQAGEILRCIARLPPAAKVIVGTQLAWRDITPPLRNRFLVLGAEAIDLVAGDVDGDGADEIVTFSSFHENSLIELDGSLKQLSFSRQGMVILQAWDYDGNGTEDILFDQNSISQCDIYNANGHKLGDIPGHATLRKTTIADFDNDGIDELVLDVSAFPGYSKVSVFATGGTILCELPIPPGLNHAAFGDVDGDGAAEIIFLDARSQLLVTNGADSHSARLPAWDTFHRPVSCIDIDGDGVDEVFASNHGYLNVVSGAYTQLVYPVGNNRESGDWREKVCIADLDRDGEPELIVRGKDDNRMNSGLFFFDLQGSCIYYEEMVDPIKEFIVLSDVNGDEYLLVQTEKLLIYP